MLIRKIRHIDFFFFLRVNKFIRTTRIKAAEAKTSIRSFDKQLQTEEILKGSAHPVVSGGNSRSLVIMAVRFLLDETQTMQTNDQTPHLKKNTNNEKSERQSCPPSGYLVICRVLLLFFSFFFRIAIHSACYYVNTSPAQNLKVTHLARFHPAEL